VSTPSKLLSKQLISVLGAGIQPSPAQEEAEACLRQALDSAGRRGAKLVELRAAMSLSRLWQQQGKHDAARQVLVQVYGWFTEGLDTANLREARALLKELA